MMPRPMSHWSEPPSPTNFMVIKGVVSNINGEYEIKLPEGGVDLVFSYVGYDDVLMPIVINKREVVTKDVY